MSERTRSEKIADARAAAQRHVEDAKVMVEQARESSPLVATGFRIADRDRARLGGLMAGALAYRFFLWLLPFTFLVVGILGALTGLDDEASQDIGDSIGLQGVLTDAIQEGARERGWWFAILFGLFGTAWAGMGAVRALRISQAAAWGVVPEKMRNPLRASALMFAVIVGTIVISGVVGFIRGQSGLWGLIAILAMPLVYFVIALRVYVAMPHPEGLPPRAMVPGAVLVAVGIEVLHLVTVYYLAGRAERAASVYGTIGAALTLLLWLFILARLVVGGAIVNAELAQPRRRRSQEAAGSGEEG